MKILAIYKENSDHFREVDDYIKDFFDQTAYNIERIDPYSREGESICRTYDIVEYPTLIAIDNSGVLHDSWRGRPLPQINQVSYYLRKI